MLYCLSWMIPRRLKFVPTFRNTLFRNLGTENSTRRRITQKKEQNEGTEVQHAELGTASPLTKWLKYYNSKLREDDGHRVTML